MSWLIDRSREQTDEENHPRKEELVTSPLRPGVCSVTASRSHGLQANTKSLEMLYKPGSGYRERGRAATRHSPDHSTESIVQAKAVRPLASAHFCAMKQGVGGSQGLEGPSAVAKGPRNPLQLEQGAVLCSPTALQRQWQPHRAHS